MIQLLKRLKARRIWREAYRRREVLAFRRDAMRTFLMVTKDLVLPPDFVERIRDAAGHRWWGEHIAVATARIAKIRDPSCN